MLRTRLLTAAAAVAMMAAPAAFAQETPAGQTPPTLPTEQAPPASASQPTPATTSTTPVAPTAQASAQANSVIDVLKAQGNYTTLLTALDQAQLTDTLASRPEITIFAPTDAAFAALPEADRTRLLDPANAQELRDLLLYHVIVADVTADQIEGAAGPVETAGGVRLQIDGSGDAIMLDGETTASANIDASNGGVFPIDRVLMPNASQAAMGDDDAAPAATTEAATPATPATPAAPSTTATPPAGESTMTPRNAPNGQPAAATTTTANPPVQNPTDGAVDDAEDTQNPGPTPN